MVDVPTFSLGGGERVALRGGSGSGKTTFLNLLAGILVPDSGEIRIADEIITGATESRRDRIRAVSIGYIFQTFNLLQGFTALENVELAMRFGHGIRPDVARGLLDRVGLRDRADFLPRQLSVGQQQRVAVARALANRPKLVLADEPTGNLDFRHAAASIALIREVCSEMGATLLLVSHDRDVLAQFERVLEFSDVNHAARRDSAIAADLAGSP